MADMSIVIHYFHHSKLEAAPSVRSIRWIRRVFRKTGLRTPDVAELRKSQWNVLAKREVLS